jgi:lipopolysaccharide/colanic/teichoic acid biosynthesis glycosyltransferase
VKIVISGASGSVGEELIPILLAAGHTLCLISRDPGRLLSLYPTCQCVGPSDWDDVATDFDLFLHLAVQNSNVDTSLEAFLEVNSELAGLYARRAKAAGIGRFVFPSSIYSLMPESQMNYAVSKIHGARSVRAHFGEAAEIVYLGAVYGRSYYGKLKILNRVSLRWRFRAFLCLSALRPTTNIQLLLQYLTGPLDESAEREKILTDDKLASPLYRYWVRLIDSLFVFWVLLLSPVLLVVWLLVVLEGGRPGIFTQTRIGQEGRPITVYKIRTMKTGTNIVGSHLAPEGSITRAGKFLRSLKIDELPQALNVAKSEMTLIGPRPSLPSQLEVISSRASRSVLNQKPGLTGWAQVQGVDMSAPQLLANLDSEYRALQSVSIDLFILRRTFFRKRAHRR